jgi:hypothetical protein
LVGGGTQMCWNKYFSDVYLGLVIENNVRCCYMVLLGFLWFFFWKYMVRDYE